MKRIIKKLTICFLLILPLYNSYGQSTLTISQGSSVSVGAGSDVAATNRDGTMLNSGTFNSRSITFDPVATTASSVTQSSFYANWNASSGASGYRLDVSTDVNFGSFITGYQNLDVGSFTIRQVSGLSTGTTYYYRVRAYDIDGITGYSNIIPVTTGPANPVASAGTSVNEVSFSANWGACAGATRYQLDVATDNGFTSFVAGFNDLNVGNVITYSVTGLIGNTTYYYRVRAYNSNGSSDNSNVITVLTAPIAPVATNPNPIAQTSFTANWNASAGATGYRLDVSTNSGFTAGTYVTGFQNLDVSNVTNYSVSSNLNAGTTYYYRVRAYSANGTSGNSNVKSLITVPPDPVASAASGVASASFIANWTAATSATGYKLDVSTDAGFGVGTFVAGYEDRDVGNVITLLINSNISGGLTYYYRIRAYNASGTSGSSGNISLLTMPPAPVATAASNFTQTIFSANWGAAVGATKYYLDVSTSTGFSAGTFVTGYQDLDVGNVVTYSVNTNLNSGTVYYYRVRAFNATGTSDNSNQISLSTVPTNPVAVSASNINESSFYANWNSSATATGYLLDVSTDNTFGAGNFVTGYHDKDVGDLITYQVTGISTGTTYYYRVKAYSTSGTSGVSGTITVLTAPAIPVPLAASAIHQTDFTANWNSCAGVTGYQLDVSTDAGFGAGTFVTGYQNKDIGNNTTALVNTYLTAGTTYYYRVRAYNASGASTSSGTITLATIPSNPLPASATSIAATSFTANWNSSPGATGYRLDVSTNSGFGAGTFVTGYNDIDVSNVTTYSVNSNLTEGTTYYYRVRAYNSGGTSGNSTTIIVTTVTTVPVTIAATSIIHTGFTANWNSLSGATGYFLDIATDNIFNTFVSGFNNNDVGNVTSYVVSGLDRGTTYYYRVRAYNVGGTSGNSNIQTVVTLSANPTATAATAIAATSFSANWGAVTGTTGYYLDVATDNGFTSFVAGFSSKDVANVTTFSVTGLTAGNTYYYRVRSYNAGGTGQNSNVITVTTAPPAPVEQAATVVTNSSFVANWTASTGAAGYYLDVATDNGFTSFVPGFNTKNVGNVITFTVTGLTVNTQYYYRISAYNTGGTSAISGTITLTTLAVTPPIPAVIPGSNNATTSLSANWNASAGATGYRLDVSTDIAFGAGNYVTGFQDLNVNNVTTYSVTGLTAGNIYYYRVRAYNGIGTSTSSNIVMVKTIPPAPVEQAAASVAATSFDAKWNAAAGATGYYIDVATDNGFTSFLSGFNNRDVGNVTTFTVTGLTGSTNYYYRIRAYNTGGISVNSGTITTLTIAGGTVIATAATSILSTSFIANWNAYAGAVDYILDVSTSSGFGSFVPGYQNLDVHAVTNYTVTGLTAGINYYYRVTAYNGVPTNLGTSGTINVITLPPSPVAIAPASITEISFDAKWNASTSATGYYLDVATDNGFTSFVTGFNNKYVNNVLIYSVTGLTGGTTYYYRVRAKNGSGTGDNSNTITTVTVPHLPNATYATAITNTAFNANWDLSPGATGYRLDVSIASNFSSFVGTFNDLDIGNVTNYTIPSLSGGTVYYYRVRAYNVNGTSNSSGSISTLTIPSAPTAIAASSISKTSFVANWNSTTGATKYYLDVATTIGFTAGTFVSGYQNLDVNGLTTYSVSGLSRGTNYFYRVRAFNTSGTSDNSSTITALTISPDPEILSATNILSTSFTANWNASTGATGYRLDVSTVSDFSSFVGSYNNLNVNGVTTYSVTGLTGGTTYYYRVRSYDGSGTSGNSGTMTLLTLLTAPTAIAASLVNETNFLANWNPSSGADGYKLDISTDVAFGSFIAGFNGKDVGSTTSYSVTGLNGGTTYYYRVKSYSGVRISDNSNQITVLTKPTTPVAAAASSITGISFNASWSSVTGATKYYLDVATDYGFTSFVALFNNKDVGNTLNSSVTGLSTNTTYYYRVRAEDASGTSGNSGNITVLTAPAAPSATAATSITNVGFSANWNSSAGAIGYRLDVSAVSNFTSFIGIYNNKDVGNVTSYSVTGLSGSTPYYYRVRAYNASATSDNSSTINPTTAIDPSGTPVATAATSVAQTSFAANWNIVGGATGYRLDVSTDWSFSPGTFVAGYNDKDVGNVLTSSVTNLTAATTYYYRVRSYNSVGTSGNSGAITVLTVPAPPVEASATSIALTSFSANWNASTNAVGYNLDVATDIGFSSPVAGFNSKDVGNVLTCSVTSLSAGVTYYYRIRAYNGTGASTNSGTITVVTIPSSPTANTAASIAETSFSANWNSATGASKYYLDVSTNSGFTTGTFLTGYENLDVGNVTSVTVTGMTGGSTYYYRVRANNVSGTSGNSGTITTLTLCAVPITTSATAIVETSFSANWNSVNGAVKYYLDVSTNSGFGGGAFVAGFSNRDVSNVTTFSVTGLSANTNYYYRVRAYNASGESGNSSIITVMTAPLPPAATAATQPHETFFIANWNASVGATGYRIDVSSDINFGPGTFADNYENRDAGNVLSDSVTNISSEVTYYYRIRAYNGGGGISGNSGTIKLLGTPFAKAATSLSATGFTAGWFTVASATGYRLDVSTDINFGAGNFLTGFQDKDVSNVTSFSVTGITSNLTYYYRVRAYDATYTSNNSNSTMVRNLPPAPVATAATAIKKDSFVANWNAATGGAGYKLDVAEDPAFKYFVAGYQNKVVYNVTKYAVTGLVPSATYYYRVRAYNSMGDSDSSNTISLFTLGDEPVANAATSITSSGFVANWNSVFGAVYYYLDVATDAGFAQMVGGYNNKNVGNVTSFAVASNVIAGTSYYYRVKAVNAAGVSGNSNIIELITVPGIPVASGATLITTTTFNANWNSVKGASGYYLDVYKDTGFVNVHEDYCNKNMGNSTSCGVSAASSGTTYYYRVRAFNAYGISKNSNRIAVTTIALYNVNLSVAPSNSGTVKGDGAFAAGTQITVTATPNIGYKFTNWTLGNTVVSTSVQYSFTLNSDASLVANFATIQYGIVTSTNSAERGTAEGGGNFQIGQTVSLKATSNPTYQFVNWTVANSIISTSASFTFTINKSNLKLFNIDSTGGSQTFVANFEKVTGIKDLDLGIPTVFRLEQNYPNPFNPTTIIRYGLPKDCNIKILIYDILGKEIGSIVDQYQQAGYHEIQFNASRLNSGIYIYVIQSAEIRIIKKMLLLK